MASVPGSTPDFHRATTTYLFTAFKGSAQADAGPQLWIQATEEVDYDESDDKAARAAALVARKHATCGKGYSVESIYFVGGSAFERQAAFHDLLIQVHHNAKTVRAYEPVRILHARRSIHSSASRRVMLMVEARTSPQTKPWLDFKEILEDAGVTRVHPRMGRRISNPVQKLALLGAWRRD